MSPHPLELIFVMQGGVKIQEKKAVNFEQCSKHASVRQNHKKFRLEGTVESADPASAQSRADFNIR